MNDALSSQHRPFSNISSCALLLSDCALSFVTVWMLAFGLPAAPAPASDRVEAQALILHSYHVDFGWTREIHQGLATTLSGQGVRTHVEFMDTKRFSDDAHYDRLREYLAAKYADIDLGAVVVSDNNAYNFALRHRKTTFKGAPVVFCGVNDFEPEQIAGHSGVTGVVEAADFLGTIEVARRLCPRSRRVVAILDRTPTGRAHEADLRDAMGRFQGSLSLEVWNNLTYAELCRRLSELPADTIVLYLCFWRDRAEETFSMDEITPTLVRLCPAPIFTAWASFVERGAVGGRVVSGVEQGRVAGQMALRILSGESADAIPVQMDSPNVHMFSHEGLKRLGVANAELPEGAIVLGEPPSFVRRHRFELLAMLAIVVFLLVSAVVLLTHGVRRRRMEIDLRRTRERLDLSLRASDLALWDVDLRTGELTLGERWARLVGRPLAELEGEKSVWGRRIHPEDREAVRQAWDEHVAGRASAFETEYRVVTREGEARWVFDRGQVVEWGSDGSAQRAVGAALDITGRKRAETALRDNLRFLQTLLDNIASPVFYKDREGRYLGCNHVFANEILGLPREAIVGKTIDELSQAVPAEYAHVYRERDQALIEGGEPKIYEAPVRCADGHDRPFLFSQSAFADAEGRPAGVVGVMVDLSERERAERQRQQLEAQIQQAQKLESLGVLAGGIAHDFNNLLLGILGNADLALLEIAPVAPARDYLREIETAARRAAELCQQMLAYSGRGRFETRRFDLRELIEEMGHLLEVSIAKNVVLRYRFAPDLPSIQGDPSQIRQLVMNLLINASEAIGERSGVVAVSTGVVDCDRDYLERIALAEDLPEGTYVSLEVSDNGCGMDAETLERVFDPFFSTKFTGRGLGLAAVQGIVRGHRGAIKVYSEPGSGTTFKVLLPASDRPAESLASGPGAGPVVWEEGGTVLLVDDEEMVRAVGRRMLERSGFEVVTASNGKEALDWFRDHADRVDVVVLDLTMPHMGGEEAYREMRRTSPNVRVILSSGYSEEEVIDRFAGKGITGFLQKPYPTAQLVQTVIDALSRPSA